MTKSSTALMSLIAAVPGGFLAFLLVMAFLNHADTMGGALNLVVGVTLLCAVAAALMPVGIVVFGGPKGAAKPKAHKKKGKDASEEDEAGDSVVGLEDEETGSDEFVDKSGSPSGVSDEYEDSDESGELVDEFESGESSDLLEDIEEDKSDAMMDAYDDDAVGKHEVSDEWDVPESDLSDQFEFDDAVSDDDLDFNLEEDED